MARNLFQGKTTSGASVTVYWDGTTTKPTIYVSETGGARANPFTADQDGSYGFWIEDGHYEVINGSIYGDLTNQRVKSAPSTSTQPSARDISVIPFMGNTSTTVEEWLETAGNYYQGLSSLLTSIAALSLAGNATKSIVVDGPETGFTLAAGGGGVPGGADTQVQYNNAGAFDGNAAFTFNSATGAVSATTFIGALTGNADTATTATTATNATNIGITDDTTTNATMYPTWVTASTGNLPAKVSSTKLFFNPSTSLLSLLGAYSSSQAIGATSTDGLLLSNPTAATVGAQKWSSRAHFHGSGWGTTAGAAQDCDWIVQLSPVQGTNPLNTLDFRYSTNGAAYTTMLSMSQFGLTASSGYSGTAGTFSGAVSAVFGFNILSNTSYLSFGTGYDVILQRGGAAANLQLGTTAANPPVAQTLSVQDASGTDIAGATWKLRASRGTGAGVPGALEFQTSTILGSSTTLQTATTRFTISHLSVTSTLPIVFPAYTVAGLPAGVAYARAFVTDALAPAFGAAVAGGGAVVVPVYFDGAAWNVG